MGAKHRRGAFAPNDDKKRKLHRDLEFTATEQYKLLRTNLSFTLPEDEKCPIIGVTSSIRGEGKSTTSINLAYVLAENEKKVLLIDGDLRLPSIAKSMNIENNVGLTDFLMNRSAEISQFRSEILSNWYIIPSGEIPPNPSELLGSQRMKNFIEKMKNEFDYIVIDLPPVNIVSDALTVSNLITGMVVVIREDYTEKRELERCFRLLKLSNINVLGCVMNDSRSTGNAYGRYRRYKYYKYYKYYQKNS